MSEIWKSWNQWKIDWSSFKFTMLSLRHKLSVDSGYQSLMPRSCLWHNYTIEFVIIFQSCSRTNVQLFIQTRKYKWWLVCLNHKDSSCWVHDLMIFWTCIEYRQLLGRFYFSKDQKLINWCLLLLSLSILTTI